MQKLLPETLGQYKFNYDLSHLTWMKVGGSAEVFYKPKNLADLISFLRQNQGNIPIFILGAGSNLVIRDGGIKGVVIRLGNGFTDINYDINGNLSVDAGCLNFNLAKFCALNSITNLEFLASIPGTIGGGIAMNAGCYGMEFKDILIAIEALDKYGNELYIENKDIGFHYRGNHLPKDLIFTKAILKKTMGKKEDITDKMSEMDKARTAAQPIKERTSGSTFANPPNQKAWELIDQTGLRGQIIGDAKVSELHCNFIINRGNATADDIESLCELMRNEVKNRTNIDLIMEIRIIGQK